MFGKKGGVVLACAAFSLLATAAYAGTYCKWGSICDSNFDSWARSQGFYNGNAAISNYNGDVLKWIENNTDADRGWIYYHSNAAWNSPAWWSNNGAFLSSLDNNSTFEEMGRYYFVNGYTDKGCSDAAGAASPYSFWRSDQNCCFMSSYNSGWTWKSVMMHEDGHLLRNDGFHHDYNSYPVCCMDTYDMANYATKAYCFQCIPVVNAQQ